MDRKVGKITTHNSKGVIQGYAAQAAVDSSHQIIIAADVIGSGSEQAMLIPMIEQHLKDHDIPALIADNQMRKRDERFAEQGKYKGKPDPLSDKVPTGQPKAVKRFSPADFTHQRLPDLRPEWRMPQRPTQTQRWAESSGHALRSQGHRPGSITEVVPRSTRSGICTAWCTTLRSCPRRAWGSPRVSKRAMRGCSRHQAQMRPKLRHTEGMNQKILIGSPSGAQRVVGAGGKRVFLQPR